MRQGKIQQNTKQPEMHSIYYIHNVIKVTEKYGKQKCKILIYIYMAIQDILLLATTHQIYNEYKSIDVSTTLAAFSTQNNSGI